MDAQPDGELDLTRVLARYGLAQIEEVLRANGFDDWDTVGSATESDLHHMQVSLGDRRKLQRAVQVSQHPPPPSGLRQSDRVKRRYRKHPKLDPNAPTRPKTAYVLFGEHTRTDSSLQGLSFADAAKEIGKKWQALDTSARTELWEKPAADRLQRFKADLEEYEETAEYRDHQSYLVQFYKAQSLPESSSSSSTSRNLKTVKSEDAQPSSFEDEAGSSLQEAFGFPEEVASFESMSNMVSQQDSDDVSMPPLQAGMEEVEQIYNGLGVRSRFSRVKPYPPQGPTRSAIDAFVHNTGSLLFLWTQDETKQLMSSVYESERGPPQLDATELFAMAAIGSYCDGDTGGTNAVYQQPFMDAFVYLIYSHRDIDYLRAMRLFACLAICRFTNSVLSARRLMSSALRIGREIFGGSKSSVDMDYWWPVYRTILFLESWFAYNTGFKARVTEEDLTVRSKHLSSNDSLSRSSASRRLVPDRANPDEQFRSHEDSIQSPSTLHERVGDLGRLATYISLDLKKESGPDELGHAKAYLETLNDWHRTLPPPMQLSRLNLSEPLAETGHTKRALLQLHILFLGLFIEPFRRCLVDIGEARLHNKGILGDLRTSRYVEEQSVLAARQSARVASLLQVNNLVRSHCWVAVYTSFTACAILLFSASQKLLLYEGGEVSYELLYASSHLNLLSLCSHNSTTARTLYSTLQTIFNEIRELIISPVFKQLPGLGTFIGAEVAEGKRARTEDEESIVRVNVTIRDLVHRILDVLQQKVIV